MSSNIKRDVYAELPEGYLATYTGSFGSEYHVFQNTNGMYGWVNRSGYGFTNESYQYILEYLREAKGVLA
jgi:hypothetical protein